MAHNKSIKFSKVLMALSIGQFVGLFYITYGLWGWDVGEPVSYLIALTVDLWLVIMLLQGMPTTR